MQHALKGMRLLSKPGTREHHGVMECGNWLADCSTHPCLKVRALGSGLVLGTYAASEPLAAGDLRGMQVSRDG